jgi:hypothetical protein
VLSGAGQKIFALPDIRKLPVRPAVYRELPPSQFDPFVAAAKGGFSYDAEVARPRMALTTAIFEQFLTRPHDELANLWARVHRAEAVAGGGLASAATAARRWLSRPPVSESEAAGVGLRQTFQSRQEAQDGSAQASLAAAWRADGERNRLEA